jgi:hypothetical protein
VALGDPEPARFTLNGNTDVPIPDRWQRAGVAVVRCHLPSGQVRECRLRGTLLDAGNVLPLPGSTSRLLIEEVQPDADVTAGELRVRFIGHASVIDLLRVGDRDREQWVLDGRGAIIRSLDARRSVTGTVAVGVSQEAGSPSAEAQVAGPLVAMDAVLSVGLDRARAGWRYRTHEIRAGGPFTLTTPAYVVRGVVLAIGVPPARTSDEGGGK